MKAGRLLRHPVFIASLLYLSLSWVKGESKHCFVVPKVCDIYDGGYAVGSKTVSAFIKFSKTEKRSCIPRKDTDDPKLLQSVSPPDPSKVCKVPVGVGTSSSTFWWATCSEDCYEPDTNNELSIDCPKNPGKEGKSDECDDHKPRCMQDCAKTKCQFPFWHNGYEYTSCTRAGDNLEDPSLDFLWCPTEFDANGNWTMRAECECFDPDSPIEAKAKSEGGDVSMDVLFRQDKLKGGKTTMEAMVTGLKSGGAEYDLTVFQATDTDNDCAKTHGPHFNPSGSQEHSEMVDGRNGVLKTSLEVDSQGVANFSQSINNIKASLYDDSATDCPTKTLLRRVLVVEEIEGAERKKLACATIQLLGPPEDPLPTILIIIFCIIFIIAIIAAIIIYCLCCKRKRKTKEEEEGTGGPEKPKKPEDPERKPILDLDIPYVDDPVRDNKGSIDDLDRRLFVETHYTQTVQSQESISSDCNTSNELI